MHRYRVWVICAMQVTTRAELITKNHEKLQLLEQGQRRIEAALEAALGSTLGSSSFKQASFTSRLRNEGAARSTVMAQAAAMPVAVHMPQPLASSGGLRSDHPAPSIGRVPRLSQDPSRDISRAKLKGVKSPHTSAAIDRPGAMPDRPGKCAVTDRLGKAECVNYKSGKSPMSDRPGKSVEQRSDKRPRQPKASPGRPGGSSPPTYSA